PSLSGETNQQHHLKALFESAAPTRPAAPASAPPSKTPTSTSTIGHPQIQAPPPSKPQPSTTHNLKGPTPAPPTI
ncbi:unnamed protein product, partial [Ilex paraguariensis]